ncbi:MAG: hypothetical protein QF921_11605 [Pseudomonadales bacterium]|jgi:hypothetical protein|nr:hypothetical protein [Pseudomonadales bacterium]MDP6470733.1 hypothetical protein [Pseudomonadales bacterium]MDP6828315.1 hypothetical protein [Pseudomonadales bacterium]MDP6972135.1 hypothetical protein [Pseudomonadales bacterium]|tara:strand:- start:2526 stop:3146 length:621 start_codon:yes stop_codon:yes gene_type:complete
MCSDRGLHRVLTIVTLLFYVQAAAEPPTERKSHFRDGAGNRPNEQLLAAAPEGWLQTYFKQTTRLRIVEFVPAHESRDWRNKVRFEAFTARILPDPIEFMQGLAHDQAQGCKHFSDGGISAGFENGYATSTRLFVCENHPADRHDQITMVKSIRGNERFYVIARARRGEAIAGGPGTALQTDIASWALYLRAIHLCEASSDAHPCP